MFAPIISTIVNLFDAAIVVGQTLWDWLKTGYAWIIALIVVLLAIIQAIVDRAYEVLSTLVTSIANIIVPDGHVTTASQNILDTANTFFPVSEGFIMLIAFCALWAAAITYRLIKSWLPTLS